MISILWFIIFVKVLLFWLWLWQVKEYHLRRFRAHFEAQKLKKIVSSFWRIKYPKFTLKIVVIFFACLILELLLLFYLPFVWAVIFTVFLFPFFILAFQIPTVIWRKFIMDKARAKRAGFTELLVIGITGSYGKTSTKEFLSTVLSEKFNVLKTKEHQNSEVGVSLCILKELNKDHEIFICEMGAYVPGGIKLLCDIAQPKIGILTGINEQHMATQGSQENIIKTKYELIESLPEDGTAFFNGKDKYCQELYQKTKVKKQLYGQSAGLATENLEGAKAVARELGMTDQEIALASQKIENKFPGIEIKQDIDNLKIIDATYSANPQSVITHLEYIKGLPGRKIMVMPCLIELGPASREVHLRIGRKIKEVCDLAIITTGDRFKAIKEAAGEKVILIEDGQKILEKLRDFTRDGDTILLESRVPKLVLDSLVK